MKYKVTIGRVDYYSLDIEVEADSEEEAGRLAKDLSCDEDGWLCCGVEYLVNDTEEVDCE
jgi:hypothetical protein